MMTVLLLLAAGVALAVGYVDDQPPLVWVALALSVAAAVTVVIPGVIRSLVARRSLEPELEGLDSAVEEVAEPTAHPGGVIHPAMPVENGAGVVAQTDKDVVVFVPGRLTFHAPSCSAVAGRDTSSAVRSQLETGGMTPCRRCLDGISSIR